MNKPITLSLLCAVFMGVSARAQTQDTVISAKDTLKYGRLICYVKDCDGRKVISNAIIKLDTIMYTADNGGKFSIDKLVYKKYKVVASCYDYKDLEDTLLIENTRTKVTIFLKWKGISHLDKKYHRYETRLDKSNTSSMHIWTGDEINNLPGH